MAIAETANYLNQQEGRKHEKYERLLEWAEALAPLPTAVAHPCDESSLGAAVNKGGGLRNHYG